MELNPKTKIEEREWRKQFIFSSVCEYNFFHWNTSINLNRRRRDNRWEDFKT